MATASPDCSSSKTSRTVRRRSSGQGREAAVSLHQAMAWALRSSRSEKGRAAKKRSRAKRMMRSTRPFHYPDTVRPGGGQSGSGRRIRAGLRAISSVEKGSSPGVLDLPALHPGERLTAAVDGLAGGSRRVAGEHEHGEANGEGAVPERELEGKARGSARRRTGSGDRAALQSAARGLRIAFPLRRLVPAMAILRLTVSGVAGKWRYY